MTDSDRLPAAVGVLEPGHGVHQVSDGCRHCYAERFAERWRGIPGHHYEHGFDLQLRPERLELPLHWRQPRRVFVDSMGDLFHGRIPDEYVREVFAVMERAPQHVFHVLTKRQSGCSSWRRRCRGRPTSGWASRSSGRIRGAGGRAPRACRRPCATSRPSRCSVRSTRSTSTDIDLVIAGGESGAERRPPQPDWLRGLRDRCVAAGVAFTFKGWGGRGQRDGGRLLDGREWDECRRWSRPRRSPRARRPSTLF